MLRSAELGFFCSLLHPASQAPFIGTFWTIIKPGAAPREPGVLRETRKQEITDAQAVGAWRASEREAVSMSQASTVCPQDCCLSRLFPVLLPVKPAVIKGFT